MRADWRRGLDGFVADLGSGEDRVPLERVLRRHRAAFTAVLATGRTWPQIARALTDAGARHKQGQPMDAKQLRTVYGRTASRPAMREAADADGRGAPTGIAPTTTQKPARATITERRLSPPVGSPSSSLRIEETASERVRARLAEARRTRAVLKDQFEE